MKTDSNSEHSVHSPTMEHLTEPQKKAGNEWLLRDCPLQGTELGTWPIPIFTVALRSRHYDLHGQVMKHRLTV